ncbi:hypothetical protein BX600DRAFT_439596 [Xylariales sp. PMI_506]|nr:hypothetical protein BX600DRAFT_439596 [Xylariales sp. PMI_506]
MSHFDGYFLGDARVIRGLNCGLEAAGISPAWFFAAKGSKNWDMNFLTEMNEGIRPVSDHVEYAQILDWLDVCKRDHGAVWGAPTADAEDVSTGSGLPTELPRVVQDAIILANSLGYRYLLVDKYCIPQHDMDARAEQIRNMDVIYHNADVTFIAAAGHSAADGIPGVSNVARDRIPLLAIELDRILPTADGDIVPIITIQPQPSQWTKREVLVLPMHQQRRRLIFHVARLRHRRRQVRRGHIRPLESDAIGFPRIANEYARRQLKFASDRLNAFDGMLVELSKLEPLALKNLCGVPLYPFEFENSDTPNTLRFILGLISAPVIELELPPDVKSSEGSTVTCDELVLGRVEVMRALNMQKMAGRDDSSSHGHSKICLLILASHSVLDGSAIGFLALSLRKLLGQRNYERLDSLMLHVEVDLIQGARAQGIGITDTLFKNDDSPVLDKPLASIMD